MKKQRWLSLVLILALVVTKLRMGDANTMMAEGGIQAADKPNDSPAQHFLDAYGGGHFAAQKDLLYKLVMDAPEAIQWLSGLGVEFDKAPDGTMITTHGGGTSRKRMHAAKDYSGAEIMRTLRDEVLARTGITATVGIGPNLFQAKVALDITAKHVPSRIGILDDETFRKEIWPHRPITDIWGIGPGVAARLEKYGVYDLMGVAALDENLLYDELGVNAEYLIDHAFGREPTTIADIQAYRPQATSTTTGQVLSKGYAYEQAYTVLREMVDNAVLDLVDKHVVCDSISLFVGYASERADIRRLDASGTAQYVDGCGHLRSSTSSIEPTATAGPELAPRAPKPVQRDDERRRLVREAQAIDGIFVGEHGGKPRGGYAALFAHSNASRKLSERTNSFKKIMGYFDELWAQTVDPKRPVKRINLGFGNLMPEEFATIDLFSDIEADERERDLARAVLAVKGKYGKNALVKGLSFTAGATARERNEQVGGHRA